MIALPKLYAITDARLANLSHAAQTANLIAGGAQIIQLREKHANANEFYEDARRALEIAKKANVRLIINDRVDIALAIRADGVHLGQEDLTPCAAREILGEAAIIGCSTHNPAQAEAAIKMPIDYLAFGPIFPTASKQNPDPVVGLNGVRKIRTLLDEINSNLPLVAIGGITGLNAAEVLNAGANTVAVISDLLREPQNIAARTKEFLQLLSSSNKEN